jgi:hypothetical protein
MTDNEFSQAERRKVLKDTYFARQQNTGDDAGGRFTKLTPTNVTGSTPVPSYPQQPPNSPWHHDPVPATEPLGFDIEFVGELGGASPVLPCAVESATPDREGPEAPPSGPSPFSRRRQW